MKIRIKFTKQGPVKFIGHLDILRYFQKAMRRADVPIKYSEGFSPHQIMSFAAPLGVGLTSNGEYMDIEVTEGENSKEWVNRLNQVMVEGIEIISYRRLPDTAKNAMSIVAAADYTLRMRENWRPKDMDTLLSQLKSFLNQENILITKKTKKGEKSMDLRPLIFASSIDGETLSLKLSTGSTDNVKPEMVMEAFYSETGREYSPFAWSVQREEVYALDGRTPPNLCALEDYGEDIE